MNKEIWKRLTIIAWITALIEWGFVIFLPSDVSWVLAIAWSLWGLYTFIQYRKEND